MKPDADKLIEQLVSNTRALLEDHWNKAESVFAGSNIKIMMAHSVELEGDQALAKTTIAFGARVKDEVESVVRDNGAELPMEVEHTPKGKSRKRWKQ